MSVALIKYDAACKALAAAKTVVEVTEIRNAAEAMRAYARQAKNKTLEIDAAEIRIRAERRVGELIRRQKATIGLAKGGTPYRSTGSKQEPVEKPALTIAEVGIDKKLSMRSQRLAGMSIAEFLTLIATWRDRVQAQTERVTTNLLREDDRDQIRGAKLARPLPAGLYRLIYADPPWQYEHVVTESRAIENQYPTMALEDICQLSVPAAPDAVLFLWTTSPKLAEAMQVIAHWDFTYRTCAIWDKEQIGMGYYFRQQHELLLVAARGALPVPEPARRPASIIRASRTAHSAKPIVVAELLEQMYPSFTELDRIELFGRSPRPGWTTWSNEPAVAS